MKLTVFRISVAIWTLVLGLLSVYFYSQLSQSAQYLFVNSINVEEQLSIVEVASKPEIEQIPAIKPFLPNRFTPTFRACKPGYTQGYETDDGVELSEGSECPWEDEETTSQRFESKIERAKTIIERKGGRIILEFEENGKHYFEILRYSDGDRCIKFIHAPSLEIAFEFEKWEESQEFINY